MLSTVYLSYISEEPGVPSLGGANSGGCSAPFQQKACCPELKGLSHLKMHPSMVSGMKADWHRKIRLRKQSNATA